MRIRRINQLNTTEPRFAVKSKTHQGGGLRKRRCKKGIIEKCRMGRMSFGEKNNIRRMGSNEINTVGMFWAKFGRNGTIDVEESSEREPLKVVGKGGTSMEGKSDCAKG